MNGPMRNQKAGTMLEKGQMKNGLGRLFAFCRQYLPQIIIALACAVGGTIFTILGPDKLAELTNIITAGLITGIDMDAALKICWTLVTFYGISAALTFTQGIIMTIINQRISKGLRAAISQKIHRLPISYFNNTTFGDVLSRVTNDVDGISEAIHRSVVQMVSAVALLLGCLVMMFKTNWLLALTAIVASITGFSLISVIMRHSQKYFVMRQEWLGKINGHIEETYSGHDVIRAYNGQNAVTQTFDNMNEKLYESNWKSQFLSGLMMPIMGFVGNLGYVAVCVVGALLVINGHIKMGVIVAFMVYIRLFTNPLSQIAQGISSLQSAAAASIRVFGFLDAEELSDETHKTQHLEHISGEVVFDHVRFGYTPDRMILKDFSAVVRPGQKVAIVGPTGAGKTTLVNLLMRFYELSSGEIRIDGIPETDLTRKNIHDLFGMVLQDTWLFEGSIRENVVYGKENISNARIKQVCKAVGMHHFINTLPQGYDTVINEQMNISEGQKQLLTIARAMIEDAPMLILDEATSSVDTRTEILIQRAIDKLTEGRTSFVIAHRLSTIKNADMILVMKDGDIIESGAHEELLAKKGFYADLYNSQFEPVA